jgi:hypothetical protein
MDDLVAYSCTLIEHLGHLGEVFKKLEKAGFTLKPDKLCLAQEQIFFLMPSMSPQAIKVSPEQVDAIMNFPLPKNLKGVRTFLGMAGISGHFTEHFSLISEPFNVLKCKNVRFVCGKAQQTAFEPLKEALSMPPILQIPDFSHEFTVVCDASDVAISAVHQKQGEGLAPVTYSSRLLSLAERRYSIHKKECLHSDVWL